MDKMASFKFVKLLVALYFLGIFGVGTRAKSTRKWEELKGDLKYLYDPQDGNHLARLQKGLRFFYERKQGRGSYHFGYDSGPGPLSAWHFREESRSTSGVVRGRYGFAVSRKLFRVTEYVGDELGYRSFSRLIRLEQAPATSTTIKTTTSTTTAPPRARGKNMMLFRLY